jgi:hypothetical protein
MARPATNFGRNKLKSVPPKSDEPIAKKLPQTEFARHRGGSVAQGFD